LTRRLSLPFVDERRPDTTTIQDLDWYTDYIDSFSGGKDSLALALALHKQGIPAERIQLWHQLVDGGMGVDEPFMDWPCTESYCRAVAHALGMPIFFQWRHGGFERELLKENSVLAPVSFERQDGTIGTAGGTRGKVSTRRKFPQVSSDLSKRWCSPALKIDVAATAISNEPLFKEGRRILFLTGERRQESAARSRYAEMERHRCHTRSRHVDHWRMILDWDERQVWEIMREFRVMPHPAYRLGWARVSCLACIFGLADQWASVRQIAPDVFQSIADYEIAFKHTIHHRRSVVELADAGTPYPGCFDECLVELAISRDYPQKLALVPDDQVWMLPAGAYKHCCGPT
jgi:3'-phosphoadenosine 5'-phosphosulfate sulfotransferase (PAPS reductase)/FAD synthetase